jgi:hypothetical protein
VKSNLKLVPVLLLLVFGAVASSTAIARGGHGGGGHGGGGHVGGYSHGGGYSRGYGYGGVGVGIALGYGLGYYGGYYPYPYAYPAPAYAYPAPPATYVEQGIPQAASAQPQAQPQGDWYFCAASNTYYPYVRECPGGWQRVPSTPPR